MADEQVPTESDFTHRVQVTFNEATGEVTFRHFTEVGFGRGRNRRTSSTNRDVETTKKFQQQVASLLRKVIDGNREAMEAQADADAAQLHHLTSAQAGPVKLAKVTLSDSSKAE
jgi:hypothetical protein